MLHVNAFFDGISTSIKEFLKNLDPVFKTAPVVRAGPVTYGVFSVEVTKKTYHM